MKSPTNVCLLPRSNAGPDDKESIRGKDDTDYVEDKNMKPPQVAKTESGPEFVLHGDSPASDRPGKDVYAQTGPGEYKAHVLMPR